MKHLFPGHNTRFATT